MSQRVPFADLGAQHAPLKEEILAAISDVIDSSAFCLGPACVRFEAAWASYTGVRHAVALQSGTAALQAALHGAGIRQGDEVITAANTFVATAGAVHFLGARPVLVDVRDDTLLMDPDALEAAITPRTRAIVPVHLYGQPVDMPAIQAVADRHGLDIIEDACQAHGASLNGKPAGSLGRAGAFSFYPGKNLGALGEGGILSTDDDGLAEAARRFRNHGGTARYQHDEPGLNLRMHGFQGAALGVKLPHLDGWNDRRREVAAAYAEGLAGLPLTLPVERPGRRHVYHLYVVRCDDRDGLREHLQAQGVASGIHYPTPIHQLSAYAHLGYSDGDFPVAEAAAARIVSLPVFAEMSDEQVQIVIDAVRAFFGG